MAQKQKEAEALLSEDNFEAAEAKINEFEALEKKAATLQRFSGLKAISDNPIDSLPGVDANQVKDFSGFSFLKAMKEHRNGRLTGLEAEVIQQGIYENTEANGDFVLPQSVLFTKPDATKMQIGVTTGDPAGSQGGDFVEEVLSTSFIDLLYKRMVLTQAGAQSFTGLVGDLRFPKWVDGDSVPAVKAETAAANELEPETTSIELKANRLPAFVEMTQQLMRQNNVSVEAWLRNHLATKIGLAWERDAFNKLFSSANVNVIDFAAANGDELAWADVVRFETEVDAQNALQQNLHYITNSKVKGKLKVTERFASSDGRSIWQDDNTVNGYLSLVTNNIRSDFEKGTADDLSGMIFGNWADLYLGQWGGIEFILNPFTKDTQGIVRLTATIFKDEQIARDESFSICKEIVTD